MRSFQKKGKWNRIMQSKLFLVFLGILILFFIFNMFSFAGKMEETIKNKKLVEDKITELEQSKEKFSSDINKLKTEEGVEESIREKFGLAKEGENMILVTEDKNKIDTSKNDDSNAFLRFLKGWFK